MKRGRQRKKWSVPFAAERLTCSEITLWRYETGRTRVPEDVVVLAAREYESPEILLTWLDECAVYQEIQKTA